MNSGLFVNYMVACFVGYLQFMILKKSFIQLPISVFFKIDHFMPKSLLDRPDYIHVAAVEADLKN